MSDTSSFRIKKGDVEIEYHGKQQEVDQRFKEVLEWFEKQPSQLKKSDTDRFSASSDVQDQKMRKGGARTSVISSAIDQLVKENFFEEFKTSSEVLAELRRKCVPASSVNPVIMALNRKVSKTLERIKDQQDHWVYRKKK